jgi:hypothetical protein
MTAAAASTTGRLRRWLSVRHSLGLEAALVLTLYGLYELARGLVVANPEEADRHAGQLVALESSPTSPPCRSMRRSTPSASPPGSDRPWPPRDESRP